MYIFPVLLFEGCLLETILKTERDAAPAGWARNPALGRLRGSARAAIGPPRKELAGRARRQCRVPGSAARSCGEAEASPKKPRWSAERRSRPASSAGDPWRSRDRPDREAGHGCAVAHQRRSALRPPQFRGANWDDGVPRAAKNRGGGALVI